MKSINLLVIASCILQLTVQFCQAQDETVEQMEIRTWTNTAGKTINAKLKSADKDTATIEREDGKVFNLPLTSLSEADRTYVTKFQQELSAEKQPVIAPPLPADFPEDSSIDLLPFMKKLRTEALEFTFKDAVTGRTATSGDLRGKYVYIHSIPFAQDSLTNLLKLKLIHTKYAKYGFEIVTIAGYSRRHEPDPEFSDEEKTLDQLEKAVKDFGITWWISYEKTGTNHLAQKISKDSSFDWLLDPNGHLIHSNVYHYSYRSSAILPLQLDKALENIFGEELSKNQHSPTKPSAINPSEDDRKPLIPNEKGTSAAPPLPVGFPEDPAIEAVPFLRKLTQEPLNFEFTDAISGNKTSFENFRGNYVYLHVLPFDQNSGDILKRLKLFQQKYGRHGFTIVTISGYRNTRYQNPNPDFSDAEGLSVPEKTQAQFKIAVADYGIDWPVSYNPDKSNPLATRISRQDHFAWLVDPNGYLIHSQLSWFDYGRSDELPIEEALEKIFVESEPVEPAEPTPVPTSKPDAEEVALHESGLPLKYFDGLPTLEEFLDQVQEFAESLDQDNTNKNYSKSLKEKVGQARLDVPGSLSALTKAIAAGNRKHKSSPRCPDPMTALFLAYSHQDKDSHSALYSFFLDRDAFPVKYRLAFFHLLHSYAVDGELEAMIIVSRLCCRGNTGITWEERATIDERGSKLLTPAAGLQWMEKASKYDLNPDQRADLRRDEAFGLLETDQKEKAFQIFEELAKKGDWTMMIYAECLHYGRGCERDLVGAIEWYKKTISKGWGDKYRVRGLRDAEAALEAENIEKTYFQK